MERLLRYSLEHNRLIRLIYQTEENALKQVSATVLALEAGQATVAMLRPKQTVTLPLERILSADYRKGDEGQD